MGDFRCDEVYEDDSVPCPHCNGDRQVNCYCGGDLCVCDNYGEKDCPVCHGEGDVTEECEKRYLEDRRKFADMMRNAMAKPSLSTSGGA